MLGHMNKSIIEELFDIVEKKGKVEEADITELSERFGVHRNEVSSIISFYKEFSEKKEDKTVHVCFGTSCLEKNSRQLYESLKSRGYNVKKSYCFKKCAQSPVVKKDGVFILKADIEKIERPTPPEKKEEKISVAPRTKIKVKRCIAGNCFHHKIHFDENYFEVENCGCLGLCGLAPVAIINNRIYSLNQQIVDEIKRNPVVLDKLKSYEYERSGKILTRYNDVIDPLNIDTYISIGGYEGLKKALRMDRKDIIDIAREAGIRGKGGAAFPLHIKLKGVLEQKQTPKYVLANHEEGEIASYCNTIFSESNPFAIIEGMTIAGYVVGAQKGYIFVNYKAQESIQRLMNAIRQAKERGLLGKIADGFEFDIEIRRSPSVYVAGEETAAMEVIEGKKAIPRNRPPFPFQVGLFGKPTLVNNVETLAALAWAVNYGPEEFKKYGVGQSIGTKLLSLTGNVNNPCVVEVPHNIKIKDIVEKYGMGFKGPNKGFLIGGPSGGILDNSALELNYTYEDIQKTGAMLGSGAIFAIPQEMSIPALVRDLMQFFADESCGQCIPCRAGNPKLVQILENYLNTGELDPMVEEVAKTIIAASFCGLGMAAPNPLLTALKNFQHEFRMRPERLIRR